MPPHRKRCQRLHEPGDAHFATYSCFRRMPLLHADRSRQWFLASLAAALQEHDVALWAYCVMPEHVHLVYWPRREPFEPSQFLSDVKQPTTRAALAWLSANRPDWLLRLEDCQPHGDVAKRFWQRGGGYDRILRTPAHIHEKIEYSHQNPVRRGLVATPAEWPYSSARQYARRDNPEVALRCDLAHLPADHR